MKAGPKLNTLVAEAMGLEVLGSVVCQMDPEDSIAWHGSPCPGHPEDDEGKCGLWYPKLPVYLKGCHCELLDEEEDLEWDKWHEKAFGHYGACMEIVPFYSEYIVAAMEVVERLRAQDWEVDIRGCYSSPHKCAHPWSAFFVESGLGKPFGRMAKDYGDTAPLAICLAALKAKGIDDA